ncbi:DASH family cryptochrome [Chryseobacterium culicis]|uniref:DASH family cryptochrome n=1 Tax=Chryseobacterium culicis TaxID=680127 RepID=UPI00258FDD6C|nr:DASH family cryptochrome [Chryseobacterium culicis]
MPKKQKINILWFTKDLRTRDSESLYKVMQEDLPFLALYVFDSDFFAQKQFGCRKIMQFRAKFLLETVENVKQNLARQRIPFLVKYGKTADIFKDISEEFEVVKIFCQEEWTKEEVGVQAKIEKVVPSAVWEKSYSQFLVHPLFVFKVLDKIPLLFTTFRQKIEKNLLIRREFESEKDLYNGVHIPLKSDEISLKLLGFENFEIDERTAFPFSGGENVALKRLHHYFSETRNLSRYKDTRNGLVGADYSSKFSAWLSDGSLSAVTVYSEIKKYEEEFGANDSTYWLVFELLWRDFFRYTSLQYNDLIFRKNGISGQKYAVENNRELIQKWKDGETESDFVNANMLELKSTGWMSNRGRQNAASYFCKTLKQDWRKGAAYFEGMLIDYDVHSNYGNWMYLAGVGNDSRDRIFNPEKQAEIYDSGQEYRKLWIKK